MRKAVPQHQSLLGQMDRLPQGETRSYSPRSPHLTMVEVRGHSLPRPDLNTEQKGVLFWGGYVSGTGGSGYQGMAEKMTDWEKLSNVKVSLRYCFKAYHLRFRTSG